MSTWRVDAAAQVGEGRLGHDRLQHGSDDRGTPAGAGGGLTWSDRCRPGDFHFLPFLSKGFTFLQNGLPNASIAFQKLQKVAKNFRESGLINGLRAASAGKNFRRPTPGRASERPAPGPREGLTSAAFRGSRLVHPVLVRAIARYACSLEHIVNALQPPVNIICREARRERRKRP